MITITSYKKEQYLKLLSFPFLSCCFMLIFFLYHSFVCNAQLVFPLEQTAQTNTDFTGNIFDRLTDFTNEKLFPELSVQSGNKNYSTGNELLDSLYETKNFGYSLEHYWWHFYYNQNFVLDSNKRIYYDASNQYDNTVEIRTYNSNGQIIKRVKQQPLYTIFSGTDSTIVDSVIEKYAYDIHGNLLTDSIFKFYDMGGTDLSGNRIPRYQVGDSISNTYNDHNQLLSHSDYPWGEFYSYVGDTLKYEVDTWQNNNYWLLKKYDYKFTDTSKIITVYTCPYTSPPYDTVSHWDKTDSYTTTYDQAGKKVSLVHREIYITPKNSVDMGYPYPDYKATYSYTASNKLSHASYYTWGTPDDPAAWNEAMYIDYTYDADGNIKTYKKTYYDNRMEKWEVQESKTYYYSPLTGIRNVEIEKPGEINVYPNPAHDVITVKELNGPAFSYTIYNSYGEVRTVGRLENSEINVSQLRPGMYIIKIHDNHSAWYGKFVKY